MSRVIYLLIALVPWLLPEAIRAPAVVGLIVLQAIPLALFNTAFWILLADVCPPDRRSSLFTMRTTLLSATVGVSAFLSGIFLDQVPFPLNYQILNLVGFVLVQYSTYLVNCITPPTRQEPEHKQVSESPEKEWTAKAPRPKLTFASVRRFVQENRPFVYFNLDTLICWIGAWSAGPLYTIYLVRMLDFSNSWIGANSTLAQIAVVVSAPLWNKLIRRKGNMWTVLRTVVLTGLYPILIVLMPWALPILLIGFANTLNDTGIGIAHTGVFLDVIPPKKRSSFIATHTTVMNVGAMIGPMISAPLSGVLGVPVVLVLCGAIRIIGGAMFWVLTPRPSQKPSEDQNQS